MLHLVVRTKSSGKSDQSVDRGRVDPVAAAVVAVAQGQRMRRAPAIFRRAYCMGLNRKRADYASHSKKVTRGPGWKALRLQALDRDGWHSR